MDERLVISLCGPAGAGKSQLAKALVSLLGTERSVRVPTDYFIQPATCSLENYLSQAIQYDWAELERVLATPVGTTVSTPAFDFVTFRRSGDAEAKAFTIRPIVVIDAMYPFPEPDVRVRLNVPASTRIARIAARYREWGTNVAARWDQLEASRAWLETLPATYDLQLDGDRPLIENARLIVRWLESRGMPSLLPRGPIEQKTPMGASPKRTIR